MFKQNKKFKKIIMVIMKISGNIYEAPLWALAARHEIAPLIIIWNPKYATVTKCIIPLYQSGSNKKESREDKRFWRNEFRVQNEKKKRRLFCVSMSRKLLFDLKFQVINNFQSSAGLYDGLVRNLYSVNFANTYHWFRASEIVIRIQ